MGNNPAPFILTIYNNFVLALTALQAVIFTLCLDLNSCFTRPSPHAETHTQTSTGQELDATTEANQQAAANNLANIQKAIEVKQEQTHELRAKLKKPEDDTEKQELELKITRI